MASPRFRALNLNTLEYKPSQKVKFATLEQTKTIDKLADRFKVLVGGQDKAGEFYRLSFGSLFAYVSNRVPEISDQLYKIDDALRAGFGWEMGPFETWDALGVPAGIALAEAAGRTVAPWVTEMVSAGNQTFYTVDGRGAQVLRPAEPELPGHSGGVENFIILDNLRASGKVLWKNAGASVLDLGDGILNVEFHAKMNALGQDVIEGLLRGVDLAEKDFRGLVVGNNGPNFSAGGQPRAGVYAGPGAGV